MEKWIELAKCTRPHGIKGGFLVHLYNPDSTFLTAGKKIQIFSEKFPTGKEFEIARVQYGNKLICYFQNIDDRNEIENLLPFTIKIQRQELIEPEADEFYLVDLIGLRAIDQTGEEIGEVISFYDNGAQAVVQIKTAHSILELPFVEVFFPKVDLEKKEIHLIVPEEIE